LRKLGENEFQEQALDFITPESINDIFKAVPESRLFIQTLSQDFSYASDAF
jgi:predicted ATP-dependent Lon-type protease